MIRKDWLDHEYSKWGHYYKAGMKVTVEYRSNWHGARIKTTTQILFSLNERGVWLEWPDKRISYRSIVSISRYYPRREEPDAVQLRDDHGTYWRKV